MTEPSLLDKICIVLLAVLVASPIVAILLLVNYEAWKLYFTAIGVQ